MLDKRVVFAVAGSGKSSEIINRIEVGSRALVLTYTEQNTKQLKRRISQKFGFIPEGVRVYTYFTFLYSFCFRPLFGYRQGFRGLSFEYPLPFNSQRSKKNERSHYVNKHKQLYHNRLAKFFLEFDHLAAISNRLEQFFDAIYIDEVQDFAGNDFNFLCALNTTNMNLLLVGDFYQHTFNTSADGQVQVNLHKDYEKYCGQLCKAGYEVDLDMLSHSHRCSPTVCEFISSELRIEIGSHRKDEVEIVEIVDKGAAETICNDDTIIKLFYQNSNKYNCYADNWGATKGIDDFEDVCVVLNPTTLKAYKENSLHKLVSTTKNKLYVACTRAKRNLYFVDEKLLKGFKR